MEPAASVRLREHAFVSKLSRMPKRRSLKFKRRIVSIPIYLFSLKKCQSRSTATFRGISLFANPTSMVTVFVSHANADKPRLAELRVVQALGAAGCKVFLDRPEDIFPAGAPDYVVGLPGGDSWRIHLAKAMREADRILLCYSPNFVARIYDSSDYLIEELREAQRKGKGYGLHLNGPTSFEPLGSAAALVAPDQSQVHPNGPMRLGPLIRVARWASGAPQDWRSIDGILWRQLLQEAQQAAAQHWENGVAEISMPIGSVSWKMRLVPDLEEGGCFYLTQEPVSQGQSPAALTRQLAIGLAQHTGLAMPTAVQIRSTFAPGGLRFADSPFGIARKGASHAWAILGSRPAIVAIDTGLEVLGINQAPIWLRA